MADRIGQQLGNYTIVQLLGRGGFADVYLAEHIYLKTQVAVKVLQTRLSNAQDMHSFLREAQTIARLSHPHIVRVLDFGLDGEIPFLVMDYAPNGTVRQHHPSGTQLPLALVISYVKQLADALHYAHDEKVIHRDIKPENMLFGKRHEVLLSDFGVALIAQSSRFQSTQDVAGTVGYMAPEQIEGKARPASDQYSLGIVVYEWVSGDRPFHGSFTEVCTQHLFAPLPSLSEKVPEILPQVEQVIALALAKDPKQRFASVQAFAHALEQASQSVQDSRPLTAPAGVPSNQASSATEVDARGEQRAPSPSRAPAQDQGAEPSMSTVLATPPDQPVIPMKESARPEQTMDSPPLIGSSQSTAPSEEQQAQLLTPRQQNRRGFWIALGVIGAVLMIAIILLGVISYVNRSIPIKTLNIFCDALKRSDYHTAYNQFSSEDLKNSVGSEAQWDAYISSRTTTDCMVTTVNDATGTGTISYNGGTAIWDYTLVNENGTWKINSATQRT